MRRRSDGTGALALDGLDRVDLAAAYLHAAFALLDGAGGVILDLRRNGGGDAGTVALVLEWLLDGEPAHISDVIYRDRTRQWWTTGRLGERAVPPDTPVAALIGPDTFSSAGALAYHLQSRGRGRLVGARTPGAADHVTPVAVSRHTCARSCPRRGCATRSRARTGKAPASCRTSRAARRTPWTRRP
ncbi:MAG TPA: S41 family peptidase, partial [Solirubrobacteraceae bacterium]|nr:S41 family peptidase [Solirubrobacteraceae bacterium]